MSELDVDSESDASVLTEHPISQLDVENATLRLENTLLKVQLKELNKLVGNQEALKKSLSGAWKLVDSHNVSAYLKATSNAFHNLFANSDVHLKFDGDVVTTHYQFLHKRLFEKTFRLSGIQMLEDDACLTYILGDSLKTVYSEGGIEERFVENGRLHVTEKKNGVECVRIYEKYKKKSPSEGHPLMEQLKRELIELGAQRYGEKMTVEVQKEIKATPYTLENQKTLEKTVTEIESDPVFIKNRIVGKWKSISKGAPATLTFKVEHNRLMEQLTHELDFTSSIFGVPDANGDFYVVENNRIVWRNGSTWRKEYFVDGELLVELYPNGFLKKYERIDP